MAAALRCATLPEYAASSFMPTQYHSPRTTQRLQSHLARINAQLNTNVTVNTNHTPSPFTEVGKLHKFSLFTTIAQSLPSSPSNKERESEHDIALRLPQLHQMLQLLRKKQGSNKEKRGGGGPGNVYLVGTGPGDPELVTLKALRVIHAADLVLYDRLVSTDILDMVHSGATLLYVGKAAGYHSRTQDEIHQLLLSFAQAGATVVRLKGGDPLVFGRGGEEMDFLHQQGIEVKVVPGITAASGIAAELGIPLTHRGVANSVRFLTGHSRKGGTDPQFVAKHAADPESTIVIYMGLATLPALADKLILCGLSPETPAAAVEHGTTSQQRMVFAKLQNLPDEVIDAHLVSPTLIIIGKVVALSSYWPTNSSTGKQEKNSCALEVYEAA
ncbi:hypothetical protein KI387_026850 [Taxus chinensis]|uniref:uroporphyrinogen-III C-methyltransferase n=1 Tax=Taxus chinensis TaxID=29808 RepID=A0AA38FXE9_TAXCH|nr:hypothetical protein KI387_026850 [Taxus chinensis]